MGATSEAEFLEVGTLARPHGVKGEIRVTFYADSPDLLRGEIRLRSGDRPSRPARVVSCRMHQGQPVVRLEGVTDRTAAEALRGLAVLIPVDSLPDPGPEDVYLYRLIGLPVVRHADGAEIGVLDHVLFHGEQEIWSIRSPSGQEILFPAVPDFVDLLDPDAGVIRISPPPGLIELYVGTS